MSLLVVEHLRKSFSAPDGERTLIVDVPAFVIEPGEQVALHGSSGSGKTTFLHLIAGILQPDSGRVVVDGRDLAALPESGRDRARAELMGYVFQTFNLLQGYTALENVLLGAMFGRGADRDFAARLLDSLGLGRRLDYRPRQLSVGQQQRVAVARALANRPKLVLADEPTGNLDRQHAGEAMTLMCDACAEHGAALLVVSHDRDMPARFGREYEFAEINRAPEDAAVP